MHCIVMISTVNGYFCHLLPLSQLYWTCYYTDKNSHRIEAGFIVLDCSSLYSMASCLVISGSGRKKWRSENMCLENHKIQVWVETSVVRNFSSGSRPMSKSGGNCLDLTSVTKSSLQTLNSDRSLWQRPALVMSLLEESTNSGKFHKSWFSFIIM